MATSGLRAEAGGTAPVEHILALYPQLEDMSVPLGNVRFTWSNMDPAEAYVLTAIIRLHQPTRIFEIGTYDGATTLRMAEVAPDAQIWTLDLPEDAGELAMRARLAAAKSPGVGHRYRGTLASSRITQLHGDSQIFDFSPWFGSMDLVVVDAGHSYELACADSHTALRLVRSGGVIVWDDYCSKWPGVVQAVDEIAPRQPVRPVRIEGTEMAVADPMIAWPPQYRTV